MSTKSTLAAVTIVLAVVLSAWYFSYKYVNSFKVSAGESTDNAPDTTINISKDLGQVPDDSSLNKEIHSLDQDLQNF